MNVGETNKQTKRKTCWTEWLNKILEMPSPLGGATDSKSDKFASQRCFSSVRDPLWADNEFGLLPFSPIKGLNKNEWGSCSEEAAHLSTSLPGPEPAAQLFPVCETKQEVFPTQPPPNPFKK